MKQMSVPLVPCAVCARHVRRTEQTCPFCDAVVVPPPEPTRVLSQRIGRAAMFAFGLATVTGVALDACGQSSAMYGQPDSGPLPDFGISAPDADTTTDAAASDASSTDGSAGDAH